MLGVFASLLGVASPKHLEEARQLSLSSSPFYRCEHWGFQRSGLGQSHPASKGWNEFWSSALLIPSSSWVVSDLPNPWVLVQNSIVPISTYKVCSRHSQQNQEKKGLGLVSGEFTKLKTSGGIPSGNIHLSHQILNITGLFSETAFLSKPKGDRLSRAEGHPSSSWDCGNQTFNSNNILKVFAKYLELCWPLPLSYLRNEMYCYFIIIKIPV